LSIGFFYDSDSGKQRVVNTLAGEGSDSTRTVDGMADVATRLEQSATRDCLARKHTIQTI